MFPMVDARTPDPRPSPAIIGAPNTPIDPRGPAPSLRRVEILRDDSIGSLRMTSVVPAALVGFFVARPKLLRMTQGYLTRLAVNFEDRSLPSTSRVKAISSPSTVPV